MSRIAGFKHARRSVGFLPRRAVAVAVVLSLHAGLLMLLLAPTVFRPRHAVRNALSASDALRVRWLPPVPVMPRRPGALPPSKVRADANRSPRATTALAPSPAASAAAGAVAIQPLVPLRADVDTDAAPASAVAPDYIPGNGRFAAPAWRGSRPRLPGSREPVRGAPVIAMVDPRTQGVAGLVRLIGSLTGAVDPHCADVDAWRGMDARERIAHHVDPDAIAATADRYGCAPPPAPPGSPVYLRDHH